MIQKTRNIVSHINTALAVLLWIGVFTYVVFLPVSRGEFGIVFLGSCMFLFIFSEIEDLLDEEKKIEPIVLFLLATGVAIATLYFVVNYYDLRVVRTGWAYDYEYHIAAFIVLAAVYLTKRAYGNLFAGVVVVTLIYAYFGPHFPSWLGHGGLDYQRLLQISVLEMEGIFGNLTRLAATWIALFLLYAGLIQSYGAFDLILMASSKASKYLKSGVAQSAVISSMIIGSVNGSAAANTAVTGSITIPLMKDNGIKSDTAAAIESVASSGGQILPPVMGAAAFLMASLLGIPYVEVLVAGVLASFIFYISVFIGVHYMVSRELDEGADISLSHEQLEHARERYQNRKLFYLDIVKFVLPFLLLIFLLGILQYTVMYSAFITCIAMLFTGIVLPQLSEFSIESITKTLRQTVKGFDIGAHEIAPIAIIVAVINLVIDVLLTTGVPAMMSFAILDIAGGVFIFVVILSMAICIILGLGMPTVSAYILVAILVAPVLTDLGLPELATHYFVFYSAILSALTPPIAVGIIIATGIAGSNFWSTCAKALRLSAVLYLLPFMFVFHPELVAPQWTIGKFSVAFFGIIGGIGVSYGFNHSFKQITLQSKYRQYIIRVLRIVMIVVGVITMLHPEFFLQIIGAGLIVCWFVGNTLVSRGVNVSQSLQDFH